MRRIDYSGFTLIELIVVFAIFFITSVSGMVAFNQYSTSQVLESSVSEMITFLNGARSNAVSQVMAGSCTSQLASYSVRFSLPATYELRVYCNGTSYTLKRQNLPNDVTFNSTTTSEVQFNASDGISPGGTIVLNGVYSSKTIVVDTGGNITVQ